MGAITALASGTLKASLQKVYEVPSGRNVVVSQMTFVNKTNATVTVNVYQNAHGKNVLVSPKDAEVDAGLPLSPPEDFRLYLNPGDSVWMEASAADAIDYTLGGLVE